MSKNSITIEKIFQTIRVKDLELFFKLIENSSLDLRIQLKNMGKILNTGDFCDYAERHGLQSDSK